MVHLHSIESRKARRLRALAKGYISSKPVMFSSGKPFGAIAMSAAECSVPCGHVCDEDNMPAKQCALIDEVFDKDPWKHCCLHPEPASSELTEACDAFPVADAWSLYRPRVGPPPTMSADAKPFTNKTLVTDAPCGDSVPAQVNAWPLKKLVEDQNSTIAMLRQHIDILCNYFSPVASSGTCASHDYTVITRLQKLEQNVNQLAATLGDTVQKSLDTRLEDLMHRSSKLLEARFYELLRPHIDGLLVPLMSSMCSSAVEDLQSKLAESILKHMSTLIKKYDCYLQSQLKTMMGTYEKPVAGADSDDVICCENVDAFGKVSCTAMRGDDPIQSPTCENNVTGRVTLDQCDASAVVLKDCMDCKDDPIVEASESFSPALNEKSNRVDSKLSCAEILEMSRCTVFSDAKSVDSELSSNDDFPNNSIRSVAATNWQL